MTNPLPTEPDVVPPAGASPGRRVRNLVAACAVMAAAVWLGLRMTAGDEAAVPQPVPGLASVVGFDMRSLDGTVVPVATPGTPSVVMVSSETCGYCKRALGDLGAMSGGRPLPRLRLVTLEGAAGGVSMLRDAGVTGATLLGPTSSRDRTLLTFQLPGTPTFVALDARGRVTHAMVGYPGREALASWYRVMAGEQQTP
jgi:hypothetical protein